MDCALYEARIRSVASFVGRDGKLAKLGRTPADVLLVVCQDGIGWEDVYYLTGFMASSSVLLVSPEGSTLFVDPRYVVQAREIACCPVISCAEVRRSSPLQAALHAAAAKMPRKVAYAGRRMGHAAYRYIDAALAEMAAEAKPGGVDLVDLSNLLVNLRRHKSEGEIQLVRNAARIAASAFLDLLQYVGAGTSEREFAAGLEYRMKREGGDFIEPVPIMVSCGERTALPHTLPSDRTFAKGDLVMVDFGIRKAGYVCDITRMLSVGEPGEDMKSLHAIVQWAQTEAAALLAPGASAGVVDAAARSVMEGAGLRDCILHGVGHGIGLCVHEPPSLNAASGVLLTEGDVVTLEPGFYRPGWGGMRLEDDYAVMAEGACKLTDMLSGELFVI